VCGFGLACSGLCGLERRYRRQYEAMKKCNAELTPLYWEIGEEIERQRANKVLGKSVVEIMSKELQKELSGVQGFSTRCGASVFCLSAAVWWLYCL
jgi:hypothetical protein